LSRCVCLYQSAPIDSLTKSCLHDVLHSPCRSPVSCGPSAHTSASLLPARPEPSSRKPLLVMPLTLRPHPAPRCPFSHIPSPITRLRVSRLRAMSMAPSVSCAGREASWGAGEWGLSVANVLALATRKAIAHRTDALRVGARVLWCSLPQRSLAAAAAASLARSADFCLTRHLPLRGYTRIGLLVFSREDVPGCTDLSKAAALLRPLARSLARVWCACGVRVERTGLDKGVCVCVCV
jgi:hypothetical protein